MIFGRPFSTFAQSNPNRRVFATVLCLLTAALSSATTAHAAEPIQLSLQEMHGITAGNSPQLSASAQGTADAISSSLALAGVKTSADAESKTKGKFRIDSVYASGASYACCQGGSTTLDIEVSSNAETQVGFVRVFSVDSPLLSAKIGAGAIIGYTPL